MRCVTARLPGILGNLVVLLACVATDIPAGQAGLHWPPPKRQVLRIRLIAIAESDPRSSFFSTHEIFVAAQQLKEENESRLVKVVYAFLPYQPRLSEYGFDYSLIYELNATRDPSCDQTLSQMTTDERDRMQLQLRYAADSPLIDSGRRHSPLPCYSSSPEDYTRVVHKAPDPGAEF